MPITTMSAEEEYKKNKELTPESVKRLTEWVDKQPHLPKLSEFEIILFLHSCYYSEEATKVTIDNYYTVRTHCPEFFTNRDPNGVAQQHMNLSLYSILPDLTPDGNRVIYTRLMDNDPTTWSLIDMLKLFTMVIDVNLLKNGTSKGLLLISDMGGISFGHVGKLSIMPIKKYMYYLQEAMPVRLKGIHYINCPTFMDKIMAMMKPFMKKELIDVLHIHTDGLDSLYEFVPKKILPKELGGGSVSCKELHDTMKKEIVYASDYFKEEEKKRVNEAARPGKAKSAGDLFGVEGTFKKLDID